MVFHQHLRKLPDCKGGTQVSEFAAISQVTVLLPGVKALVEQRTLSLRAQAPVPCCLAVSLGAVVQLHHLLNLSVSQTLTSEPCSVWLHIAAQLTAGNMLLSGESSRPVASLW